MENGGWNVHTHHLSCQISRDCGSALCLGGDWLWLAVVRLMPRLSNWFDDRVMVVDRAFRGTCDTRSG